VRAVLAQLVPTPGAAPRNANRAADLVLEHRAADLVVFPELFLTGYDLGTARTSALELDGPELARVRAAAARARTAVVVGFAERRGHARVANSAACIGTDGELRAVYRKACLFGHEAEVFETGEQLVVADLAGRAVGLLICFDMEFPEPARALARGGADLLVTVAANMEPFLSDHRIAGQARALDNRLPHLYVNRWGDEAGLRFIGGTRALQPDGTIAAEAPDGVAVLEVTVPSPGADDDRVDYLAHLPTSLTVLAPPSARPESRP
jgi:predicted amidohydrolase